MAFALMTLTDYLADLRSRLNEATAQLWTDPELTRWLNQGVWKAESIVKACKTYQYLSTVVGVNSYVIDNENYALRRITYGGTPLTRLSLDQLDYKYSDKTISGTPVHYTMWGKTIQLYPVPDAVGTLSVYAYELPDIMVAVTNETSRFVQLCPEGWELPLLYALACAESKDKDSVRQTGNLQLFFTEAQRIKQLQDPEEEFLQIKPDDYFNTYLDLP